MKLLTFVAFIFISMPLLSRDLGVRGSVFPVIEMNLLQLIEQRVEALQGSKDWDLLVSEWQAEVAKLSVRPKPLPLPQAEHSRQFYFDPSIRIETPIVSAWGQVLYEKGALINPLEMSKDLEICWLFFNSDSPKQLEWAAQAGRACANPTFILTAGSITHAERQLNQTVYFDQGGRITEKLRITEVPAVVKKDYLRLLVSIVAVGEARS